MEGISMETDDCDVGKQVEDYIATEAKTDHVNITDNNVNVEPNVYVYPSLFTSKTLLELSNSSWSRSPTAKLNVQPYLRGCKWSPDGTCCLTVVNNDGVHITELPIDLYSGSVAPKRMINVLDSIIHVKESGLVYDFCWYPGMTSTIPETCCWLTTSQNSPIQMWDAFDGSLRCSYRGYDAFDEMEPAVSVTFNSDATKIIGGYRTALRTFDVERPGRDFAQQKLHNSASCLATTNNLLAVGSWNNSISLFSINEIGGYRSIGKMHGHEKGVTHLKFTPDGTKLVSGARKDHRLLVWDIRYYRRPINILTRVASTNQRVYFDISRCGKYLVSGGTDGVVKVWDSDHIDWKSSLDVTDVRNDNATYKFQLHKDCCNSVSIHPCRPILATGSGQFHFSEPITTLEDDEADNEQNTAPSNGQPCQNNDNSRTNSVDNGNVYSERTSTVDMRYSDKSENSLVFWWIGDVKLDDK